MTQEKIENLRRIVGVAKGMGEETVSLRTDDAAGLLGEIERLRELAERQEQELVMVNTGKRVLKWIRDRR